MPDSKVQSVRTAQEYLAKYELTARTGTVDQNPLEDGVQSDDLDLAGAVRDYATLSAEDRYRVFTHLRARGDTELLRELISFKVRESDVRRWGIHHYLNQHLGSFRKEGETFVFQKGEMQRRLDAAEAKSATVDRWAARMAIAEEEFMLDALIGMDQAIISGGLAMKAAENDGLHSTGFQDLFDVRRRVRDRLAMVYTEYRPETPKRSTANALWDTDRDGYFDHEDPQPLERNIGPLVSSSTENPEQYEHVFERPERIAAAWREIPVGHTVTDGLVSATRTGNHRIRISLDVPICAEAGAEKFVTSQALKQLAKRAEGAFAKIIERGDVTFDVRIHFRRVDDPQQASITFSSQDGRANLHHWTPDVFAQKSGLIAAHELCHLAFGLDDYYHETLTERDRTVQPGYAVLGRGQHHIMVEDHDEHAKIRLSQNDLLAAVADIVHGKSAPWDRRADRTASAPVSQPNAPTEDVVVVLPYSYQRLEQTVGGLLATGNTNGARDFLIQCAKGSANNPAAVMDVVRLLQNNGDHSAALRIVEDLFQRTHDRDAGISLAMVLAGSGHREDAIRVLEVAIQHHPQDEILRGVYANIKGIPRDAVDAAEMKAQPLDLQASARYIAQMFQQKRTEEATKALGILVGKGTYLMERELLPTKLSSFAPWAKILQSATPAIGDALRRLWQGSSDTHERVFIKALARSLGVELFSRTHHQREIR